MYVDKSKANTCTLQHNPFNKCYFLYCWCTAMLTWCHLLNSKVQFFFSELFFSFWRLAITNYKNKTTTKTKQKKLIKFSIRPCFMLPKHCSSALVILTSSFIHSAQTDLLIPPSMPWCSLSCILLTSQAKSLFKLSTTVFYCCTACWYFESSVYCLHYFYTGVSL